MLSFTRLPVSGYHLRFTPGEPIANHPSSNIRLVTELFCLLVCRLASLLTGKRVRPLLHPVNLKLFPTLGYQVWGSWRQPSCQIMLHSYLRACALVWSITMCRQYSGYIGWGKALNGSQRFPRILLVVSSRLTSHFVTRVHASGPTRSIQNCCNFESHFPLPTILLVSRCSAVSNVIHSLSIIKASPNF